MNNITLQLDRNLVKKVKKIAKKKFPHRKINSFAEASREALIEFIENNENYLDPSPCEVNDSSINTEIPS